MTLPDFSVGRVAIGGRATVPWVVGDYLILPYAGLYADERFSSDNALPVAAPAVGIKDGLSGRAIAGATTALAGANWGLGGEFGGIGAGYRLWTVSGRASVPF